jgi:hypothetical protein
MRAMIWGMGVTALGLLAGPSVAWGCEVGGRVVCQRASPTDPVVPLANVQLTFTDSNGRAYPNEYAPLPPTDASGAYLFSVAGDGVVPGNWSVTLDLSQLGGSSNVTLPGVFIPDVAPEVAVLPDLQVSGDDLPLCRGSQSACDLSGVPEGALACLGRPLGNPRSECAYFGNFVPVGDGYTVDGATIRATMVADFAIVKAGRSCYAVTQNVAAGDALTLALSGGTSHVTYCSCPTP